MPAIGSLSIVKSVGHLIDSSLDSSWMQVAQPNSMIKYVHLVIGGMLAKNECVTWAKVKAARRTVENDFGEDHVTVKVYPDWRSMPKEASQSALQLESVKEFACPIW